MPRQTTLTGFFQPKRTQAARDGLCVEVDVDPPAKKLKPEIALDTPAPKAHHADENQDDGGVSPEQKKRIERNRAAAMGKRCTALAVKREEAARSSGEKLPLDQLLIEESWRDALRLEMSSPYFSSLEKFLAQEWSSGQTVFPRPGHIFRAYNSCSVERVRVVVIGQDPYHDVGQAMGLCFSVPKGVKIPSSLMNIYKELKGDVGLTHPGHGDLDRWATQGVMLLNTVLTVRAHQANSHQKRGWEAFTDATIRILSKRCSGLVFLLWGAKAQDKAKMIDR
eukprot:scaffold4564_cov369-Prasinococcus_capsulatus_cf.AAC.9